MERGRVFGGKACAGPVGRSATLHRRCEGGKKRVGQCSCCWPAAHPGVGAHLVHGALERAVDFVAARRWRPVSVSGLDPKASRSVFGMSTCTRHRRLRVCKEHNLSIGMTPEQRRVGVQDLDSARADSRPSMLWSLNSTPPVRCIDGPLSCVGLGMGSSRVRGVPSAVPISANQIYHRQFPHVPHLLTQGCCRRRSPALPSCTSASTSCARHHGAHT